MYGENLPLFFLELFDDVATATMPQLGWEWEWDDAFLFFRAPKERLRLALSREAPLVIHLFVIVRGVTEGGAHSVIVVFFGDFLTPTTARPTGKKRRC